jgi:hypothetical protein
MVAAPGWRQRLQGARRLLFARGDDAVPCSFCGKDRHETGCDIVAGPGVAICAICASIALDWANAQQIGEVAEGRVADVFAIFEYPACLLSACRDRLDVDLKACAGALSCDLVSWGYFCGQGRVGDGLSIHLHAPRDANVSILRGTFQQLYFGSGLA